MPLLSVMDGSGFVFSVFLIVYQSHWKFACVREEKMRLWRKLTFK